MQTLSAGIRQILTYVEESFEDEDRDCQMVLEYVEQKLRELLTI